MREILIRFNFRNLAWQGFRELPPLFFDGLADIIILLVVQRFADSHIPIRFGLNNYQHSVLADDEVLKSLCDTLCSRSF